MTRGIYLQITSCSFFQAAPDQLHTIAVGDGVTGTRHCVTGKRDRVTGQRDRVTGKRRHFAAIR